MKGQTETDVYQTETDKSKYPFYASFVGPIGRSLEEEQPKKINLLLLKNLKRKLSENQCRDSEESFC